MLFSESDLYEIYTWLDITKMDMTRAFDVMEKFKMKISYLEDSGNQFKEDHKTCEEKIELKYSVFYQNLKIKCERGKVAALVIARQLMLAPYVEEGYEGENEMPGLEIHIEGPDGCNEQKRKNFNSDFCVRLRHCLQR